MGERTPEVGWALYGKRSGHRGDYEILDQDTGGVSDVEMHAQIKQLILGNPDQAPEGSPHALPWVTIGPSMLPGAATRLAVAVLAWPPEPVFDGTGRPATTLRYVDFDFDRLWGAGAGYAELYQAVRPVELPLAPGQVVWPAPADLAEVAADIDTLGFDWVLHTAALLFNQNIVIVPREPIDVVARLRCLGAILALLPYGLRAQLTIGTWVAPGNDDKVDLAFGQPRTGGAGSRLLAGARVDTQTVPPATVWWGAVPEQPALGTEARAYVTVVRRVREAPGGSTHQLVRLLWAGGTARHSGSPQSILEAVEACLLPHAVAEEVEQARTDAQRRPAALRLARAVLAQRQLDDVPPDRREQVLDFLIEHGEAADLDDVARHWSDTTADRLGGAALRRSAAWCAVAVAVARRHDLEGFFRALVEQAGDDPELADRALSLILAEEPPPVGDWPALRESLLSRTTVSDRFARTMTQPEVGSPAGWLAWLTADALTRAGVLPRAVANAVVGTAWLDAEAQQHLAGADPELAVELFAAGLRHGRAGLVLPGVVYPLLRHADTPAVRAVIAAYLAQADATLPPPLRAMTDVLAAHTGAPVTLDAAAFTEPERDDYGQWVRHLAASTTAAQLVTAVLAAGLRLQRHQAGIDLATLVWTQTRERPDGHLVTEAYADAVGQHDELYRQVTDPTLTALLERSPQLQAVKSLHDLSDAAARDRPVPDLAHLWCLATVTHGCLVDQTVAALASWPHSNQPSQVFWLLEQVLQTLRHGGVDPQRSNDLYLAANQSVVAGRLSTVVVPQYRWYLATQADLELARWQHIKALASGPAVSGPAALPHSPAVSGPAALPGPASGGVGPDQGSGISTFSNSGRRRQ